MKKYLGSTVWVLCILVCLAGIACGGEDLKPCHNDADCITTGSPMLCEKDGFCHRIECISLTRCQAIDYLNVLPIMVCEDGYCEKKPCDSDDECDWHYDPESIVEGPFACINGYCERPQCSSAEDCEVGGRCLNGFCRYCNTSAEDVRLCEDNNIVERRYSRGENCSIILDEEVLIEECGDDERCVEEMILPPEPEKPYRKVWCESLSE